MDISRLILLLVAGSCVLMAKERIPGTKVLLDPPDGFVKATQFPGYLMESTSSSIMVTVIAGGSFQEVSQGFTPEGLATKGMKMLTKEELKIGSSKAILIHAKQSARGIDFLKWMLAFGDATGTNLVVATFPAQFAHQLSPMLKSVVLSTEYQATANVDFFEGFTFRVIESGDLKFATKLGNNLLLTEKGVLPQAGPGEAVVIVGSSLSQDWKVPGDKRAFAAQRLGQTNALANVKILEETSVRFDGLDGHLIRANGMISGTEMYIEQCLLFTPDGYYIFQALVGADKRDAFTADFHAILNSFKRS